MNQTNASRLENIASKAIGIALGAGATVACLYHPELASCGLLGVLVGGVAALGPEDGVCVRAGTGAALGMGAGILTAAATSFAGADAATTIVAVVCASAPLGALAGAFDIASKPKRFLGRLAAYGTLASALVLGGHSLSGSGKSSNENYQPSRVEYVSADNSRGQIWRH